MSTGLFPFVGLPLPRISPKPKAITRDDRFEVIVIGAGPAGLMMTFLLARYGLTAESVLCIDAKANRVQNGHADGLQPQTLEVLRSLGLAGSLLDDGRHLSKFAIWEPSAIDGTIQRSSLARTTTPSSRYPHVVTIHQGKVEQIHEAGLIQYYATVVQRRSRLVDAYIDSAGDVEFPVVAKVECDGVVKTLRSKYLVGADDFPDIRRRSLIRSRHGTVFVIPRERNASGEYLTRLYVRMPCELQRILKQYVVSDADDIGKIFLVGDGMNFSMMDAYNLGWKLAYSIMGLTPVSLDSLQQDEILKTYHCERFPIAQQLIEFDRQYAAKFAAAKEMSLCEDRSTSGVNSILGCRRRINAFSSGCGIEYSESILTIKAGQAISFSGSCLLALTPGTRLPNVRLKRYADGEYCDLHDEMFSNGRFRVLCLASSDFLSSDGVSARALHWIGEALLPHFPGDVIEQFVIYPSEQCPRDWSCLPSSVKCHSEMRLYDGSAVQDAYEQFGVDIHHGALVILRQMAT
ncbi:FAD/NAD(P)-binding domain-containing protein [Aspergillus japonicus CBS 114.51]|uniref:FAD/NAD(P)-binding domain-containing protein n=1 Tax=Aspergillus japonicus CBS 114.51 TaxID=1448312 RepID=A0A8T8XDT0_ASPJA|nr:FAD/NAD(P)-binding domain-containing protein [Aspergillus japonicus CBS 114.51]RAH86128.1 FAD/NAD(P)-binding domain-containing protein [Aspergillus japonicus CBS 114.51]